MTDPAIFDRLAIRDLIENWVLWRDAGEWERFRTVWHADGYMMATWFQGPAAEFIVKSAEAFARGARPAFPRRHLDRTRRRARNRTDQDDHRHPRPDRKRRVRRGVHRPLL